MKGWGHLALHLPYPLHWSTLQIPKESSILDLHSAAATFQLARNVDESLGLPQFPHQQNRVDSPSSLGLDAQ